MARPAATVILTHTDYHDGSLTEIIQGSGIFFVVYRDRAVNIRRSNAYTHMTAKYSKVGFPNKAHAIRLKDKLNQQFNTTDFSVIEVE